MIRAFYILAVVVSALLALALYVAKTEAQSAQQRIARMEQGIVSELSQITQLENELAYLERPERLEELSRVHLQLRPLAPEQDMTFAMFSRQQGRVNGQGASNPVSGNVTHMSDRAQQ